MRIRLPLFLVSLAATAAAHVAPSPNVNNRYLKVTLLPGEVRLGFTLFFGDRPGSALRRGMDANGDGTIDEAEAAAFGAARLAELAGALDVTVDDRPARGWRVTDVGLGVASASAGALSLDLGLTVAYADPSAAEHRLGIHDRTEIADPGEGEIFVEESPGVRVVESHLAGARDGVELRFPYTGNGAPDERAVLVRFSVDPALRPARPSRAAWLIGGAVLVALLFAAGLGYRKVYG
jgi:hypothetical protein